jgi:ribulose-phosphate 3-epimerase
MAHRVLIAPSVLSADFGELAAGVRLAERMGGDYVHLDVMDGAFVPAITFGAKAVADLRPVSALPFDVHLMIQRPEAFVEEFARAGADIITVHLEAVTHAHRLLARIRNLGRRPGISIVPSTPVAALSEVLDLVDIVLIMSVNPGFGGQEIIPGCLRKVEALRRIKADTGARWLVEVDGGVNRATAASVRAAGAEVIVAGAALYGAADPAAEVAFLRGGC